MIPDSQYFLKTKLNFVFKKILSITDRVADPDPHPDPNWIRIQMGIRNLDPGGQKLPTKI
jgi:hypothetical protein